MTRSGDGQGGVRRAAAVGAVPVVVAVVAGGVWVTGGLLTQDDAVAQVLTGAWFVVAGLLAVLVVRRWRALALPVLGAWALTSGIVGGYLLVSSNLDREVDEKVTVAAPPATSTSAPSSAPSGGPGGTAAPAGPVAVAAGAFEDGAHPTSGDATLIDRPDGSRVLTLTAFATDPGPDLRVLLTPDGAGTDVDDAVDLGALKGNKGNQEYAVPAGATTGSVVIWCRAFTVAFGTAALQST